MRRKIQQTELFYCHHLSPKGLDDDAIHRFTIQRKEGLGLLNYLRFSATPDEQTGDMRTYLVRYQETDEVVGYFSLKAGLISIARENLHGDIDEEKFDTIPGVEVANFAINSAFTNRYPEFKGVGLTIFLNMIVPIIKKTAKHIGIHVIYIFALPLESLIEHYTHYGFRRLDPDQEKQLHKHVKPIYDQDCIFMYQIL